jgi:hypothetical protein
MKKNALLLLALLIPSPVLPSLVAGKLPALLQPHRYQTTIALTRPGRDVKRPVG